MAKDITVEILINALARLGIVKVGRHYRKLVEDEFRYMSPIGEPFPFVIIHDGSAEWFAKDFMAFEISLAFKSEDEYELDVARTLADARKTIESIITGKSVYLPGKAV